MPFRDPESSFRNTERPSRDAERSFRDAERQSGKDETVFHEEKGYWLSLNRAKSGILFENQNKPN